MARVRHFGPLIADHPGRRRGSGPADARPAASGSTTGSTRAASRRSATHSCRWPGSPGRPAPSEIVAVGTPPRWHRTGTVDRRRVARRSTVFEDALACDSTSRRTAATVFSAHQMGTVRMGADPHDHACDPAGRVRSGVGSAGRDTIIPGLYVADTLAVPDRSRRQPDDHGDGPRPAGRTDGPGGVRVGRLSRSGRRARRAVSRGAVSGWPPRWSPRGSPRWPDPIREQLVRER